MNQKVPGSFGEEEWFYQGGPQSAWHIFGSLVARNVPGTFLPEKVDVKLARSVPGTFWPRKLSEGRLKTVFPTLKENDRKLIGESL